MDGIVMHTPLLDLHCHFRQREDLGRRRLVAELAIKALHVAVGWLELVWHMDGRSHVGELVDHVQRAKPSAVPAAILHDVARPYMVWSIRS